MYHHHVILHQASLVCTSLKQHRSIKVIYSLIGSALPGEPPPASAPCSRLR